MRAALLVVFVAAAVPVVAMQACSSFEASPDDADAAGDAGAVTPDTGETGTVTPDTGVDAGFVSTPGVIECFTSECGNGAVCCFDGDAGTTACMTSCMPFQITFACDEAADCAPHQHCCADLFGSTSCQTTCSNLDSRLCYSDSECQAGTICQHIPCRGKTIGVCGAVPTEVMGFCNPDAG